MYIFFPQFIPIVPRDIMETLRLVRSLDPQAILGCPRCLEEDRAAVPGARVSWRGWQQEQLPLAQPHIKAARQYAAHLEEVHGLAPSEIRRKDLPVVLWSPRGSPATDLLLYWVAEEILVSRLIMYVHI